MSYSLVFAKKGVEILSLGTGHPLAQAFSGKPYDEYENMKDTDFADAREVLAAAKVDLEKQKIFYERMFAAATSWDDRAEALTRIQDMEDAMEQNEKARVMLDMLEMIYEEGRYSDSPESYVGLEWGVF